VPLKWHRRFASNPISVTINQTIELGLEHHRAGRLPQAEQLYRQVLAMQPNHPWAIQLLGMIAHQVGNSQLAIQLIRRAISIEPNADFYNNLGEILRTTGAIEEAQVCLEKCIQLNPRFAAAYNNLGEIYRDRKDLKQAAVLYRKAIELDPSDPGPYNNLGIATHDLGDPISAIELYQRSLSLREQLGGASDFGYDDTLNNLGTSLLDLRRVEEALITFRKVIALNPGHADAHNNLSHGLLLNGDFAEGWEEYEWRWKSNKFPSLQRNFSQPLWNGQNIAGQRILIHAEQGLGDSIQFLRYVPLVARLGAHVILECKPELLSLVKEIDGPHEVIAFGQPLPDFQWQVPMLSLPRAFKTTRDSIPATIPYLHADPALVDAWRKKLGPSNGTLRVGLSWAGNPTQAIDQFRSLHLNQLSSLSDVKSVTFHSLQKGYAVEQIKSAPPGFNLIDHSDELSDFSQTAALMMNLDLILSTCTSVPHLAGALGRPVWIMLPFNCDWRWGVSGESTPWYPTMRLLRQEQFGSWDATIEKLADELARFAQR
jgi:tetratricopeptide (TPR) repeat protein